MTDRADAVGLLADLVRGATVEELPALLGRVVEAEAAIRLRLAAAGAPQNGPGRANVTGPGADAFLTVEQAAAVAGVSRRWLLRRTRGMRFRHDLSRKCARFEEAGFRRWLAK